jgi:hypothetical protein
MSRQSHRLLTSEDVVREQLLLAQKKADKEQENQLLPLQWRTMLTVGPDLKQLHLQMGQLSQCP